MHYRSIAWAYLIVVPSELLLILLEFYTATLAGFRQCVHIFELDFDRSYMTHLLPRFRVSALATLPT
jgi:hypothetical protein